MKSERAKFKMRKFVAVCNLFVHKIEQIKIKLPLKIERKKLNKPYIQDYNLRKLPTEPQTSPIATKIE